MEQQETEEGTINENNMCLYPKLIKNRKYTETKKNGGNIPAVHDKRVLLIPVACGKCMECKKQKSREWQSRLLEEVRKNKDGKFITLTFSNESIAELAGEIEGLEGYNLDNQIATLATRRFLERWRKKYKISLRHWFVTELGHEGTENIHLHGMIWMKKGTNGKIPTLKDVREIWRYGFVWTGTEDGTNFVNEKTVNYVTKYVNKTDEKHRYYNSKILTSPGIGRQYTERTDANNNKYKKGKTKEYYKTRSGHKISLPVYWRNKIYTEEEREKLWIEKLDKGDRYINGEKINTNTKEGEKAYYKLLKWHRAKNTRLGYGNDEIDWAKKRYENQRRKLKIEERIKKTGAQDGGLPPSAGRPDALENFSRSQWEEEGGR